MKRGACDTYAHFCKTLLQRSIATLFKIQRYIYKTRKYDFKMTLKINRNDMAEGNGLEEEGEIILQLRSDKSM